MRRAALLVASVVVVWLGCGLHAAQAIETATFGLTPAGGAGRTALHESVRPAHGVVDGVRLFNKTTTPVTVHLTVEPASIVNGEVRLGQDGGAAAWVKVGQSTVTLPARGDVVVPVNVAAPRTMPGGTSTAAVVAEAQSNGAAVVQRVALMVYVKTPPHSPLKAGLGWVAWIAAVLLGAVVVYAVSGRGRRRTPPAPRAPAEPRP